MKFTFVLAIALALGACAEPRSEASRQAALAAAAASTLPPTRVGDCTNYVLLDNKCTKDWYACIDGGDGKSVCTKKWQACCILPGGGS